MVDFTRLDKMMEQSGVTAAHLCSIIGKQRGYIADAKRRGRKIPDSTVVLWAQALQCTPEYLQGLEDEDKKEKPAGVITDELDAQCLVQFRRLDPNQRRLFLAQLKAAADMQEAAASSQDPES